MLVILKVGSLMCFVGLAYDGIMFIPNFVKTGQLVPNLRGSNAINSGVISCLSLKGNKKCSDIECSQTVLAHPSGKGGLEAR
jgi:hypothetical protein